MVCLRISVKNSGTLYYVEEDKETGMGGESDENPHSRKMRVFWATENVSTPGWRNKIAKELRAGDLLPYGSITKTALGLLTYLSEQTLR
jgi:hypothetical protein